MKAWKLMIFMFALNGFVYILANIGVWGPTNLADEAVVSTAAIGVGAVVGSLSGTALASLAGARPGPIVAMTIFGGMFWGFYTNLFGIINQLFIGKGDLFLTVLTGFNVIIFVAAVTQIASGTGWRGME